MAKHKNQEEQVQEIEEPKKANIRDVNFLAKEWAIQKNIDPLLFKKWENQLMTEKEFEELKMERGV